MNMIDILIFLPSNVYSFVNDLWFYMICIVINIYCTIIAKIHGSSIGCHIPKVAIFGDALTSPLKIDWDM